MTSGKSTIGPILANVLGWDFYDLDKVIQEKKDMTIVEIFETHGEDYFRRIEEETLKSISEGEKVVVALGGGTLTSSKNLETIKNSGILVYLRVTPEILYKRLKNKIDRPLFKDLVLGEKSEEEFISKIEKLLESREVYYNQADLIINTDESKIGYTVDRVAKQILGVLNGKN